MLEQNEVRLIGKVQFFRAFTTQGGLGMSFLLQVPNQKKTSKRNYDFKCLIWGFLADRIQPWMADNKYVQIVGILKEDAYQDKETHQWIKQITVEVKEIKDVTYECLNDTSQNSNNQTNQKDTYAQAFGKNDQVNQFFDEDDDEQYEGEFPF